MQEKEMKFKPSGITIKAHIPTLPATSEHGDVVFNTTDRKLYMSFYGEWVKVVQREDF